MISQHKCDCFDQQYLFKPDTLGTHKFRLFTGVGGSWVLLISSSSTLFRQLWHIHKGTSPSRDWDREGTASASLRPGTSRNKAWERAGMASASLVPWPPGSPFAEPAPQSLNSRWHRRQQVCIGYVGRITTWRSNKIGTASHLVVDLHKTCYFTHGAAHLAMLWNVIEVEKMWYILAWIMGTVICTGDNQEIVFDNNYITCGIKPYKQVVSSFRWQLKPDPTWELCSLLISTIMRPLLWFITTCINFIPAPDCVKIELNENNGSPLCGTFSQ